MKFINDENEHNVQQCSPFQHQTIYILIEQKKNNSYFQYLVLIVALTKNLSKWTYSVFFEEVDEDEDSFTEEDEDLRRQWGRTKTETVSRRKMKTCDDGRRTDEDGGRRLGLGFSTKSCLWKRRRAIVLCVWRREKNE